MKQNAKIIDTPLPPQLLLSSARANYTHAVIC